jgi:ABC-type phosphate/phosphonate transport system permease subunit
MMPLGKRGGVQVIRMEVELVLKASIIIGALGAGGGGGN